MSILHTSYTRIHLLYLETMYNLQICMFFQHPALSMLHFRISLELWSLLLCTYPGYAGARPLTKVHPCFVSILHTYTHTRIHLLYFETMYNLQICMFLQHPSSSMLHFRISLELWSLLLCTYPGYAGARPLTKVHPCCVSGYSWSNDLQHAWLQPPLLQAPLQGILF